ncbi:Lymphocyte antigen 75 [Anabarilius grahami]|uniref:Lymphocyte antigen 75 n=1 Tax=Anabarilius grahami TaxID=495550 RepID=A0A3N0XPC4_ANAGA|nr:Lymphocyte antigen 75 [Anabarilius grahami]
MDWRTQQLFYTVIFLLSEESAALSYASAVNSGDDTFTIQHNGNGKCLLFQNEALKLGDCSLVPAVSWKWGSAHRLFHVESSKCLGLEVRSKTVTLFSCDSTEILRWKCYEDVIYTEYQMKLSARPNDSVTAKRDGQDTWKRGGSLDNICQRPYRRMHTSGGNSNGAPCEFPFLYNGTWHHNCLPGTDDRTLDWCSTTANYDLEKKWGTCLKYVEGCSTLWDEGPVKGRCYQVVSTAVVTWHEARDACRSQDGDLLSVSSPQELEFFKNQKDLPSKLWIGLNHLDWMQGWQWSDGSALSFAPWETAVREVYKPTMCRDGWIGWKGFCYKLHSATEAKLSHHEAQDMCKMDSSHLASLHSIEDIEMLHTNFHADLKTEVWIGLWGNGTTSVFEWIDEVPVSFTYWARAQPPLLLPNTINCVYYSGEHHTWSVSDCEKQRAYMCKEKGSVNESAPEEGCPPDGNWKRHGDACYKVDTELVFYKNSCHITINNRFEQAFINSLLKEHIGNEVLYFWTGLQDTKGSREYQWISQDGTADRVTYVYWKWPEPAFSGGCVVMSTGNPLGHWAVKNCTLFKAGNICKKPIKSMVPPTPDPFVPNPNASCAPGWVSREGLNYCYKVFHEERLTRKRSWEEAERFCEALGGHLPSLTETKDMQALHLILRDSISDNRFFWVGLNRRNPNNNNNWEWSDGRPVSMMIFPEDFNEDDAYNRDCVAFKTLKGTYRPFLYLLFHNVLPRSFYPSTFHCDAKLEWVCQIPRGYSRSCNERQPFVCETLNVTSAEKGTPEPHTNGSLCEGITQHFKDKTFEQDSLELCAYMYNDDHSDMIGTWDYTSCSDRQNVSICQHYADKPEDPKPEDDFTVQNHIFKVVQQDNLTWTEAFQLCRSKDMDLASIPNTYVQAVLTVQVSRRGRPLWIGLFSEDDGEHYRWTDNSHTEFNRWSSEATKGPCVYQDTDGFWKATECEEELSGVICHIPHNKTVTPEVDSVTCPHKSNGQNWIRFKKNCYTLLLGSSRWGNNDISDQQICKTLAGYGEILTIRDETENDFIMQQLQPFKSLVEFVWLGMNKTDEQLKWLDGSNVQFSNWKYGTRPNITERFMAGLNVIGEWEIITNQQRFNVFRQRSIVVCKIEKDPKDEFMKDVVDVNTPEGISYRRAAKKMDWYQALQECGSNGGHLASISDKTTNDNMALIAKRDGFSLWIGLSKQDVSGWPYEWSDGTLVKFSPDGFVNDGQDSEEKCVFVDSKGTWSSVNCHAALEGAICYNHISEGNSAHLSSQSSSACPKSDGQTSWVLFKDNCYAFNMYNYSVFTMESAKNVCQNLGKPTGWQDGSELDFSSWDTKPGPQLSRQASQICAVMVSSNGTWTQASCSDSRSRMVCKAPAHPGSPVALIFFIIVFLCIVAAVSFVLYQKNKHRFHSTVRYQRNFDDADSTSMINDAE